MHNIIAENDMPGEIRLKTRPEGGSGLIDRLTVKEDGKIGIGTRPNWDLHINRSVAGVDAEILVNQSDTSLNSEFSNARVTTRTYPGGGDPSWGMVIDGEYHWTIGLDNDVAGAPLKIAIVAPGLPLP